MVRFGSIEQEKTLNKDKVDSKLCHKMVIIIMEC